MEKQININVGEMAVGGNEVMITTSGIGSCVVLAIYDETDSLGGMLHAMLPTRKGEDLAMPGFLTFTGADESLGKYVDEAVIRLVEEMEKLGSRRNNMLAKLVGGASMFKNMANNKIGYNNVKTAKKMLEILGIPLENEDTGGTIGRSARFTVANGILEITIRL